MLYDVTWNTYILWTVRLTFVIKFNIDCALSQQSMVAWFSSIKASLLTSVESPGTVKPPEADPDVLWGLAVSVVNICGKTTCLDWADSLVIHLNFEAHVIFCSNFGGRKDVGKRRRITNRAVIVIGWSSPAKWNLGPITHENDFLRKSIIKYYVSRSQGQLNVTRRMFGDLTPWVCVEVAMIRRKEEPIFPAWFFPLPSQQI